MKKSKKGFWIFICPALFAFIVVQIIPTIMGIGYSFTDWNGVGKTKNFVGLNNYITTLITSYSSEDSFLYISYYNNFIIIFQWFYIKPTLYTRIFPVFCVHFI